MAVRSMPFAHWHPHWNSVAFGLGAAVVIALFTTGQSQLALALLASLGGAGSVLLAGASCNSKCRKASPATASAGFSAPCRPPCGHRQKGPNSMGERSLFKYRGQPRPLRGPFLSWRTRQDGGGDFRLLAAGRAGNAHAETIDLPNFPGGDPVLLKVAPIMEQDSRAPLLIWQIEHPKKTAAATSRGKPGFAPCPGSFSW